MNCSKSQLNVSYKYWLKKLSIFMWDMVEKSQFALGDTVYKFVLYLRSSCFPDYTVFLSNKAEEWAKV